MGMAKLFKVPLLSTDADSCGAHFQYLTKWLSRDQRPRSGGMFAKEAFHALEPPYLKNLLKGDKEKVVLALMGRLMEVRCLFGRFTEGMMRGEGSAILPLVEMHEVTQAVLERDDMLDQYDVLYKKYTDKQSESSRRRVECEKLGKEVTKLTKKLEDRDREVKVLGEKLKERDGEVAKLTDANVEAGRVVAEVMRENRNVVGELLSSMAFWAGAMVSVSDMMKQFIYDQLSALSQIYPFTPEHLGFAKVEGEGA